MARGGQIIDAGIVRAPAQRSTCEENARIRQGDVPEDWSQARCSQKAEDARWTRKHGKFYYGYKLHANVNRRHELIRQYGISLANEHASQHCEALLDPVNTRKRVLTGSACSDTAREGALKAKGYQVGICRKGTRDHLLSAAAQRGGWRISKIWCLWSTRFHA